MGSNSDLVFIGRTHVEVVNDRSVVKTRLDVLKC